MNTKAHKYNRRVFALKASLALTLGAILGSLPLIPILLLEVGEPISLTTKIVWGITLIAVFAAALYLFVWSMQGNLRNRHRSI